MKVKDAIKTINEAKDGPYSIYEAEFLIDYKEILAENVDLKHYKWYETSITYYKLEDGILGITGLSHLFNERISPLDCNICCHAFEGEWYPTFICRPKNEFNINESRRSD